MMPNWDRNAWFDLQLRRRNRLADWRMPALGLRLEGDASAAADKEVMLTAAEAAEQGWGGNGGGVFSSVPGSVADPCSYGSGDVAVMVFLIHNSFSFSV